MFVVVVYEFPHAGDSGDTRKACSADTPEAPALVLELNCSWISGTAKFACRSEGQITVE